MNPHHHAIEKLYAHLHSSAQGLSQTEAAQRLARYGANQIEEIAAQPFIVPFGIGMLLLEEMRKMVVRRRKV